MKHVLVTGLAMALVGAASAMAAVLIGRLSHRPPKPMLNYRLMET